MFLGIFLRFFFNVMMSWWSGNPLIKLKQLPPVLFGTWGGLGILPPLWPPTITSPLVKAGRVPLAGITEGANLPTRNIQVQAQVSSLPPNLILSNHECRWRSRSAPLGLYTLYPWTGVILPDQFQLRSQDPCLPSAGLILRLWWLTESVEALQPLLPWSIPLQFHGFYLTLGQQVVFQKLELQESPLSPPRLPSGQTPMGIKSQTCLVKSQRFTTEPSWQPIFLR